MRINAISFKGNPNSQRNQSAQRSADCAAGSCKKPSFGEKTGVVPRAQYNLVVNQLARTNALLAELRASQNSAN